MTLTLELTAEEEAQLRAKAASAGLDEASYVRRLIEDADLPQQTLADTLKDLVGIVEGTPGPGDGRAWSEVEAATLFRPRAIFYGAPIIEREG